MGSRGGEGGSFDILHLKKKRGWGKMANLCGSGGRSLSFKLEKKCNGEVGERILLYSSRGIDIFFFI